MKKLICLGLGCCLALLCGCGGKKMPKRPDVTGGGVAQLAGPEEGDVIAVFTTSAGEIRAVLYPDKAPMAVYDFTGLARTGYYTGTEFWRAEYGFAVQGGDAAGGTGGSTIWSNEPFPLEASSDLRHYAGALCAAFAQGGERQGGTGQFYFVTALPGSVESAAQEQLLQAGYSEGEVKAYAAAGGLPYLDNTDTVFGQVYAGMDVVDKIAAAETLKGEDGSDSFRPAEPVVIESIEVTVYAGAGG